MSLKKILLKIIPSGFHPVLSDYLNARKRAFLNEKSRIGKSKRYQPGISKLLAKPIQYTDAPSFLFMYEEIFLSRIYDFETDSINPYIIDCGANIGLSTIFFKDLYPKAEVISIEADPNVFQYLEKNIRNFELEKIVLKNNAAWKNENKLSFTVEGADAGFVNQNDEHDTNKILVDGILVSQLINRKVDFLKIDIEGAELTVLNEIKEQLHLVDRIFIEYHSFTGQKQEFSELIKILEGAGYRYIIQHVGAFSPHPFKKIIANTNMDLQLNIYGYRS